MTVVVGAEHGIEEGERAAERDLGAIENEVKHLAESIAEHATTIDGLREDRNWITTRFEALERDLAALPRVPEELTTELRETIAHLAERMERLESATIDEEGTNPPRRGHDDSTERENENGERKHERRNLLDHLF